MTTSHLILAIMLVESNANIDAVGDNGTAHDAYSYEKSRMIFTSYMHRYATPERLGRAVTPQDIARIHNGGPNGWKKESTEKYWEKVKDVLEYAE